MTLYDVVQVPQSKIPIPLPQLCMACCLQPKPRDQTPITLHRRKGTLRSINPHNTCQQVMDGQGCGAPIKCNQWRVCIRRVSTWTWLQDFELEIHMT